MSVRRRCVCRRIYPAQLDLLLGFEEGAAVSAVHDRAEDQCVRSHLRTRADGGRAPRLECCEQRAFGCCRDARLGVFDGLQSTSEQLIGQVFRADLNCERTLSRCGRRIIQRESLGHRFRSPDSREASCREHDGIEILLDAFQPGVDVAADVVNDEVGASCQDLRGAARGSGTHPKPGRSLCQGDVAACAPGVTWICPQWHSTHRDPGGRPRRQVLVRVHGKVTLSIGQCLSQRAHEYAGAAELRQGFARDIALSRHRNERDIGPGCLRNLLSNLG